MFLYECLIIQLMNLLNERTLVQIRAAALTATQCASYDQAKQWWMRTTGMRDSFGTHFGASMVTGLATTTVTAPVDLIKTRMFIGGAQPSLSWLHCRGMGCCLLGMLAFLKACEVHETACTMPPGYGFARTSK